MKKRFLSIALAAAVSLSAITALSAGVSAEWVKSDSGYSYKSDTTGKKLTGWQTIGENKYYFDKNGYALTGWKKISGDTYYFNSAKKGKMLTGWATIGDNKYYFGSDGVMRTGFIKLSGKTYYFDKTGKMRTGKLKISGTVYNFGSDGVLKGKGSSSSDSSDVYAPMKGLKWGMSMDEVIEAGEFDDYYAKDPMLIIYSEDPYTYYMFNDNDELALYGYISEDTSYLSKLCKYFENDGWELESKTEEGSSTVYLYSKGNKIGGVVSDTETVMLMVLSDELIDEMETGEITSISEIAG